MKSILTYQDLANFLDGWRVGGWVGACCTLGFVCSKGERGVTGQVSIMGRYLCSLDGV